MLMNFGPINQTGGERRLNVAFSRAKKHMALVTSIHHHAITNDYNDGARALKNYLRYAEALSSGDIQAARRVLWQINPMENARSQAPPRHVVIAQLAERLRQGGYAVEHDVGQSGFRCHLAVRASNERHFRLGVMVDTESYYQNEDMLEREVLRPCLLRNFGWNMALVLTKDWHENADVVLEAIKRRLTGSTASSVRKSISKDSPMAPDIWKRYFELKSGAAGKFWEISLSGNLHTIRFGRIGSEGQNKNKTFPDAETAARDARRLIDEKLAKGYVELFCEK
jgi:predicted DNA-binding WGR domain protein